MKISEKQHRQTKRAYTKPVLKKIDNIAKLVATNEGSGADGGIFLSDTAS